MSGNHRPWAVLAVLGVVLAGCAAPNGPRDQGGCPVSPGPAIRLASGTDLSSSRVRTGLLDEWNRLCPQHQVQLVELTDDADLQRSQMVAAEQSGSAAYDVLNLDVTWTAEFAKGGLIRELPWQGQDDFLRSATKTVEYDHKVYARPFNTDAGLLYYRKDLLAGAGARHVPPTSWQELEEDVTAARRVSPSPAGFITQLGDYEGRTVNAMEAIWDAGGELVDSDGKVTHDTDQHSNAQKGLSELVDRYHQLMPGNATSADESASLTAFASGQVLFMRNWPYAYQVLKDKIGEDAFGVTTLPGASVLGGQNLAITKSSGQAAAAQALIEFLTSPESERCLLQGGFAATRSSAYKQAGPQCPLTAQTAPHAETGSPSPTAASPTADGSLPPYADTLRQALDNARPRPVTPYYEAFTHLLQSEVGGMLQPSGGPPPGANELFGKLGGVLQGKD